MDDVLLMLVHPTGEGDDEKGKWIPERALLQAIMQISDAPLVNDVNQIAFLHTTTSQYALRGFNTDGYTDGGRWDSAFPANPYNLDQDWGCAGWCNTNNFNFMGTFTAPVGLQLSPLIVAYSGQPYNLTIGSDLNGDTIANDRSAFATDRTRPSVVIAKYGAFDTNPMPGQTIDPRNYLTGAPMWNLSMRVSKTFRFPAEAPASAQSGSSQPRYGLGFNADVDNVFNHLNRGGFVGNLASPCSDRPLR